MGASVSKKKEKKKKMISSVTPCSKAWDSSPFTFLPSFLGNSSYYLPGSLGVLRREVGLVVSRPFCYEFGGLLNLEGDVIWEDLVV